MNTVYNNYGSFTGLDIWYASSRTVSPGNLSKLGFGRNTRQAPAFLAF